MTAARLQYQDTCTVHDCTVTCLFRTAVDVKHSTTQASYHKRSTTTVRCHAKIIVLDTPSRVVATRSSGLPQGLKLSGTFSVQYCSVTVLYRAVVHAMHTYRHCTCGDPYPRYSCEIAPYGCRQGSRIECRRRTGYRTAVQHWHCTVLGCSCMCTSLVHSSRARCWSRVPTNFGAPLYSTSNQLGSSERLWQRAVLCPVIL